MEKVLSVFESINMENVSITMNTISCLFQETWFDLKAYHLPELLTCYIF